MYHFNCSKCKQSKHKSDFYRDKSKKTGYRPECKPCSKKSVNKERRREYEKKYWDERREDRRKIILKSHNKNKAHHKQQRKIYLQTEQGKERHRQHGRNRLKREKEAFVEDVCHRLLYEEQGGICYLCDKRFEFNEMERDHVIPLCRGGKTEKTNLKMACATCNKKKGAKLLEELSYPMV